MIVQAYAKINLGLDTLYRRNDGYHEVKMVMASVDLSDTIELTELEEDVIKITSSETFIPNDASNLAYKAAEVLKKEYKINKGVTIHITKNIPVSAGLAGGSSDAAAVLKGLNELWELNLTLQQLFQLGEQIGSDVNFCIYGGMAVATGRGEIITPIKSKFNAWIVLVKPTFGVSTKEVYDLLDCTTIHHPNTDLLIRSIEQGNYKEVCNTIGNTLESVTLNKHPELVDIKRRMKQFGCDAVLMSGSGPSVFGIVNTERKAKKVFNSLKGFCKEIYIVRIK